MAPNVPPIPAPSQVQLMVDVAALLAAAGPVRKAADSLRGMSLDVGGILRSTDLPEETDLEEKVGSFRTKWEDELEIVGRMFAAFGDSIEQVAKSLGLADQLGADSIDGIRKLLGG